jgi:hypothetical protein
MQIAALYTSNFYFLGSIGLLSELLEIEALKESYLFCTVVKLGLTLWEEHGLRMSERTANYLACMHMCISVCVTC